MAKQTALGKKILELRKGHRMTQTDLAQKVGVSTTAISQFEKGVSRPSLDTLDKLSMALGEDISKLYPHIGEYPIATAEENTIVSIAFGKYNQPKWEYLRRNEEAWPEWAKKQENPLPYPVISLPPQLLEEGNHRVFPLAVKSMEPTFGIGDLLLFTLLERDDWDSIDAYTSELSIIDQLPVYAVEVRGDSMHYLPIGRLTIDEDPKFLICHYDNRSTPTRISMDEVHEIWKFRWSLSRRYRNLSEKFESKARIEALEETVSSMERRIRLATRDFETQLSEILAKESLTIDFMDKYYEYFIARKDVIDLYREYYGHNNKDYFFKMRFIVQHLVDKLLPEFNYEEFLKQAPKVPKRRTKKNSNS